MISFYLMGEKGLGVLDSVIQQHGAHLINKVVTARDKNLANDYSAEIETLCKRNQIKLNYRELDVPDEAPYVIAVSWRWLLPLEPNQQLIVLHDSLLPRYRGFAPLVNALINGEKHVGVTALFASESYDTGSIIAQKSLDIQYPLKIESAIKLVSPLYNSLVNQIVSDLNASRHLQATPQAEDDATYSLWRDDEDYFIDWNKSSIEIRRFIDAVGFPYLGAACYINGSLSRIQEANEVADIRIENRDAGKVVFVEDGFPIVVCGSGLLKIMSVTDDKTTESLLPLKKFRTRFS